MKIAYFDCFSGASGDKIIGSLLDAGLSFEQLQSELSKLNLDGFTLATEIVRKQGIAGTKFNVQTQDQHAHRHLHHIQKMLEASSLAQPIIDRALAVFTRLAKAEAKVHNTTVEKIHFHEVGALDAIVDVVGAVIGLDLLKIERLYCSPIATGTGFVNCAHGTIPVPVPATVELLTGFPVKPTNIESELTTPTGAAILTTLVDQFGLMPEMTVRATGYGAGTRELEIPNHLRVMIGEADGTGIHTELADLLETNIDDMNPELLDYVADKLKEAGAVEIYFTPIQMKKNRPAVMLSVLSPTQATAKVIEILFRETTSLGLRQTQVTKRLLSREIITISTVHGDIRVKIGRLNNEVVNIAPEYDDCRAIAQASARPIKEVYELALHSARQSLP